MRWIPTLREPSLDELLSDDMMTLVTRRANLDRHGLRALLRDLARRLPAERLTPPAGCSSGRGYSRSAA